MNARIEELLVRAGLWQRRADPVGTWSRGMKQKLAMARLIDLVIDVALDADHASVKRRPKSHSTVVTTISPAKIAA